MIKLVFNELYKIIKQKYLVLVLLIVSIFCIGYARSDIKLKADNNDGQNWRQELETQLKMYKAKLDNGNFEYQGEVEELENEITVLELQLDNDISNTDWRMDLIYEYMSYKDNEDAGQADSLLQVIKKNDWRTYYKELLEKNESLQKEYSRNEYEYYELEDLCEEAKMRLELNIEPASTTEKWNNECLQTYMGNKHMIRYYNSVGEFEKDNHEISVLKRDNKILHYSLYNNIKPNESISYGAYLKAIADYRLFVILIMIFITAHCVCQEYQLGTLKHLLTYSKKRSKIIWSKFLALVLMSVIVCMIMYVISIVVGNVFYEHELSRAVLPLGKTTISMNYYLYIAAKYLFIILESSIFILCTMMFSVIAENIIISLGIMLGVAVGIPVLAKFLYETHRMEWVKYIPTLSFNMNQFFDGIPFIYDMKLGVAIFMCVVCTGISATVVNVLFTIDDVK